MGLRQRGADPINDRPQRRAARVERSVPAVPQLERALHTARVQEGTKILVDVGLAGEAAESANPIEVGRGIAEHWPHHCVRDRVPQRIHDHGPGVIVLAAVVGVKNRSIPAHPVVEHVKNLRRERRRCRAAAQHLAHHRPHRRSHILGGAAVHHARVIRKRDRSGELIEEFNAVHGAVGIVVTVHKARRRLVVPVQQQPARTTQRMRVLLLAQEALPFVATRAESRQPPVQARGPLGQPARREVRRCRARRVRPVERESKLVRRLPEVLRRIRLAFGQILQRRQVESVTAKRRTLAGQRDDAPVRRRGSDHRAVHGHGITDRRVVQRACVHHLECSTHALEQVVGRRARRRRTVRVTQLLGEHIAHVMVRRSEAPRVVTGATDQQVHRGGWNRHALRLDAGAGQVNLLHDLGVVVAELRAHHRKRVGGCGPSRIHHEEVRCLLGRHGSGGRIRRLFARAGHAPGRGRGQSLCRAGASSRHQRRRGGSRSGAGNARVQ